MQHFTNAQVKNSLAWEPLIDEIRSAFAAGMTVPQRMHFDLESSAAHGSTLLLMPAWSDRYVGVKTLTVFPGNSARQLPSIDAIYTLFDGQTGRLLATMDAAELTSWRTAATSALAATYLSRSDASVLLIVGAGKVARKLALAHAAVRPIQKVLLWGRRREGARDAARDLEEAGLAVEVIDNLEKAARMSDIISCATLSVEPIVLGDWLKPGSHLDLVGSFRPSMRECDDTAVVRASIFVDTRSSALHESGDLVIPIMNGVIQESSIRAELSDLVDGRHRGRASDDEITIFKSVGDAKEDLAAAGLVYRLNDIRQQA